MSNTLTAIQARQVIKERIDRAREPRVTRHLSTSRFH